MADIEHRDIPDGQIHEPKGISNATAGQVYVADGTGSGTWRKPGTNDLNMTEIKSNIQSDLDTGAMTVPVIYNALTHIADVSTAETVYIPIPADCTVIGATMVIAGTISAAPATISFKDSTGASLGTDVTVPTSSTVGDILVFTSTTNSDLTGPTYITVETDGASTDVAPLFITVTFSADKNTP